MYSIDWVVVQGAGEKFVEIKNTMAFGEKEREREQEIELVVHLFDCAVAEGIRLVVVVQ